MVKNLTAGKPAKLILMFTIPLMLGNLFQQLYNMADTLIVGRTIGVQALAAVGCTGSINVLIIGFVQGMTYGFSIITAQYFGAKDETGVRRSFAASVILSLGIALVLTAVSVPMTMQILHWMRTPEEIIQGAHSYLSVIFMGMTALVAFNLLFNVIRALGDSKTPLLFLGITCLLNIGLDFLFILRFSMGVAGAAWATVISQAVSGVLCLIYIRKKLPVLRMHKEDWKLAGKDLVEHLKMGLPVGFQNSIIATGSLVLQIALNQLGAMSVAAYTAAQKIEAVTTMPMGSFGTAIATYAAQNYGARKIERIRQGVRQATVMAVSFAAVISVVTILAGKGLAGIFLGKDQMDVIALTQTYLRINCPFYFCLQILVLYRGTLQGLGKSFVPTVAGAMELIMRIFAALFLAKHFGFSGACFANPSAWFGACLPVVAAYFLTMRELQWQMQVGKNAVLLLPAAGCATMDCNGDGKREEQSCSHRESPFGGRLRRMPAPRRNWQRCFGRGTRWKIYAGR